MQTIDRDGLKELRDERDDLVIVEVLSRADYRRFHIPGAINVPLGEDFELAIQAAVPDRDRPVVVYCQNLQCHASPTAARKMEALGYREVYDYAAGKADWQQAGERFVIGPRPGQAA